MSEGLREMSVEECRAFLERLDKPPTELAKNVVARILTDLVDRRGFAQAWEDCDDEARCEIEDRWRRIVDGSIADALGR